MIDAKNLHYNRPMFTDQVMPKGELTLDPLCHACWYYMMLAQQNKLKVGDGPESQIISYDTWSADRPLWQNKNYKAIAKSVAVIYGCESPEDFLKFIGPCLREARRLGIQFDEEICYPWKSDN